MVDDKLGVESEEVIDAEPVFEPSQALARWSDFGGLQWVPQSAIEALAAELSALVTNPDIFRQGIDFDTIPGTSGKPVLLKPGAEKLCVFYRLAPKFPKKLRSVTEDWTGEQHGGEPFFSYEFTCKLYRDGQFVAEAMGSCNSWEGKYRYREQKRTCPSCGAPAIIRGKVEFGGGWICFRKQNGCGAKFADADPAITGQPAGLVPNPQIFDVVNTILKMAQKRALIAAVLIGCGVSGLFTQDIEEWATPPQPVRAPARTQEWNPEAENGVDIVSPATLAALRETLKKVPQGSRTTVLRDRLVVLFKREIEVGRLKEEAAAMLLRDLQVVAARFEAAVAVDEVAEETAVEAAEEVLEMKRDNGKGNGRRKAAVDE